jgi:tryptophanyl-tRNA synthetase
MTILTGIRVNSKMHIGNFLGGVLPMVELSQNLGTDRMNIFIPDLHSFTTPTDFAVLGPMTMETVRTYLASGLVLTDKITLYRQSRVSAHSELAWILSCFAPFGEVSKMTQFKDKYRVKNESVSSGLFLYPVLMAADILLYDTKFVPVGEDQKQHIELARDLAIRINNRFDKPIFVVPAKWSEQLEFTQKTEGIKIRSLQTPSAKMSKSVEDPKGTILMSDKPEIAYKKVMSAVTDSVGVINWDWENQAGITNLLQIYQYLGNFGKQETLAKWVGTTRYGDLKQAVAIIVRDFLIDFQAKLNNYSDLEIEKILQNGEIKANTVAKNTLLRIQKEVGLR